MAIIFARASLRLVRGTEWRDDIQLVDKATGDPVNLAGITGMVMRIRRSINSPILLELAIADNRLVVVDAATGLMGIRVNSVTTRVLPENNNKRAKYVYDAVIERSLGAYEPAVGGRVTVLPQITRPWQAA